MSSSYPKSWCLGLHLTGSFSEKELRTGRGQSRATRVTYEGKYETSFVMKAERTCLLKQTEAVYLSSIST